MSAAVIDRDEAIARVIAAAPAPPPNVAAHLALVLGYRKAADRPRRLALVLDRPLVLDVPASSDLPLAA